MEHRAEIEKLQLQRLQKLIKELREGNRFYQKKLKEAGVNERVRSLEVFSQKMPFTTKMDVVWDRVGQWFACGDSFGHLGGSTCHASSPTS